MKTKKLKVGSKVEFWHKPSEFEEGFYSTGKVLEVLPNQLKVEWRMETGFRRIKFLNINDIK